MNIDRNKLTPMMKQYFEVKDRYPDCILFFRLGDFYEMFFEDAIVASKTLRNSINRKIMWPRRKSPYVWDTISQCQFIYIKISRSRIQSCNM